MYREISAQAYYKLARNATRVRHTHGLQLSSHNRWTEFATLRGVVDIDANQLGYPPLPADDQRRRRILTAAITQGRPASTLTYPPMAIGQPFPVAVSPSRHASTQAALF